MLTEIEQGQQLFRDGLMQLLAIKDSDIRLDTLKQGIEAVDKGIHIGGAFSATIPLVSLFYGGIMRYDVEQPTAPGQDLFVLSKGHGVAAMATIMADLGYFDRSVLSNSRSIDSILNGHPGPVLPGVHIATGPLAQGLAVAQGYAMALTRSPRANVFCVTGDGELQEGVAWEAIQHAPAKRLDNFCVLVDKNEGQLDTFDKLHFQMANLAGQIEAFGWRVFNVDGENYLTVMDALERFLTEPAGGRPTAIVCNTRKGFGAFSYGLNKHKISITQAQYDQESALQQAQREAREADFLGYRRRLVDAGRDGVVKHLDLAAERMLLAIDTKKGAVTPVRVAVRTKRAPLRDKKIRYDESKLPRYEVGQSVQALDAIRSAFAELAKDSRVVSVDSDLGSTSGLQAGIAAVDQDRAINVGVAESNMMCVGEAYATLGYNAWVSTFCPFFDWKVMRRTAVGAQERLEDIASPTGWLSEGHGVDLTYLATASNFDTQVNGATHMGNDDIVVYSGVAGVRIIDVSCPNLLLAVTRWIMDGNRGINYVRMMRAAGAVLHPADVEFAPGRSYWLRGGPDSAAVIVSSGRGVHAALEAAEVLETDGTALGVLDMPSVDEETLLALCDGKRPVLFAEQNNGFLWHELGQLIVRRRAAVDLSRCVAINAADEDGHYQYVHSATLPQLLERFGLSPEQLARRVKAELKG